jgi:pimeloyl-ACP methyl ester carboxylesterase
MDDQRLTRFHHDDLTFDVIDSGPLDGIPVVLLHGFPQRASSWDAVAAILHAHGCRTYAPDQRGYSPGARPPSRFDYRIPSLVDDVVALIDAIGSGPVHVVGHDWGAIVAWALAGSHPELVRSLTAVSVPHPGAFAKAMVSSSQPLKSSYIGLFQLPVLPERLLSQPGGFGERMLRGAGMTREMIHTFRTEIVAYGALRGGLSWYRSMMLAPKAFGAKVATPTTHVWSDGDTALGRKGAELTADFVTGPYELVVLEGVSHWVPDEAPAALAEAIVERIRLS